MNEFKLGRLGGEDRFYMIVALLGLCLCTIDAAAAPRDGAGRSAKRWQNQTYGLSILPPAGATSHQPRHRKALVQFFKKGLYTIDIYTREHAEAMDLQGFARLARQQVAQIYPDARELSERPLRVSNKGGVRFYFLIPAGQGRQSWVIGQSIVQRNSRSVVVMRLETNHRDLNEVRPEYEAMVDTFELLSAKEIQDHRQHLLDRGGTWLDKLDAKDLRDALVEEQWLRIIDHGKDIGYMVIRQLPAKEWEYEGLKVQVQSRVVVGTGAYDSEAKFFLSDSRDREFWSIKTTIRPQGHNTKKKPDVLEANSAWAETGLRAESSVARPGGGRDPHKQISVTRETPSGHEQFKWEQPREGKEYLPFLSQVEMYLMGSLIPHRESKEYGFYAYSPLTGKVSFRTDRVHPMPNGTFKIFSRVSAERPEQISHYDKSGVLIERMFPDGRRVIPATSAQVNAIWQLR